LCNNCFIPKQTEQGTQMLLFLDTRNDRHYVGPTTVDLVLATGRVLIDTKARCALIDGQPDGVSFADHYTYEELVREIAIRAAHVLVRDYGFQLFHSR
jgi:hypothetical protein